MMLLAALSLSAQRSSIYATGKPGQYLTALRAHVSGDTLYLGYPKPAGKGLQLPGYVVKGAAASVFHIQMQGIDSITITSHPALTASKAVMAASDTISMSYTVPTDTFGVRPLNIEIQAWKNGLYADHTVEVRTFDNFWGASSLSYNPMTKVTITSQDDIDTARALLRNWLWPGGFPTTGPDSIVTNYTADFACNPYRGNLLRIDRHLYNYHIWQMEIFRLVPITWNGKAVIIMQGHFPSWTNAGNANDLAHDFLGRGYEVFFGHMPEWRVAPTAITGTHNTMGSDEQANINVLTAFVDYYVRCMNWIEANLSVTEGWCAGVSTGGLHVLLAMAVDERFTRGISLNATYPCDLVSVGTVGSSDLELSCIRNQAFGQNLYRDILSYEDIYIIAGSRGRDFNIGINTFDSCCWFKRVWQLHYQLKAYAANINSRISFFNYNNGTAHGFGTHGRNIVLRKFQ